MSSNKKGEQEKSSDNVSSNNGMYRLKPLYEIPVTMELPQGMYRMSNSTSSIHTTENIFNGAPEITRPSTNVQ